MCHVIYLMSHCMEFLDFVASWPPYDSFSAILHTVLVHHNECASGLLGLLYLTWLCPLHQSFTFVMGPITLSCVIAGSQGRQNEL